MTDNLLTAQQLAARWENKVPLRTIERWRSTGQGPKYMKLGGKVLYPLAEVEAFEARSTVGSVAEYQK